MVKFQPIVFLVLLGLVLSMTQAVLGANEQPRCPNSRIPNWFIAEEKQETLVVHSDDKSIVQVGLASFLLIRGAQRALVAALPTIMSYTGTVVSGVGTIQAAGIGPLASFAAAPVTAVALPAAGVAVTGYVTWKSAWWLVDNGASLLTTTQS